MAKVNIKVSLITKNNQIVFETTGHYRKENNILTYKEKDNTIVKYHYNDNILIRENKEILLKYIFKKNKTTQGTILIKDLDKNINIDINTIKINISDQNIDIVYRIEEEFNYKIEVN